VSVVSELTHALASPAYRDLAQLSGFDYLLARDADVLAGEVPDELLALLATSREDWERWQYLRENLVADHTGPILDALATGKHGAHVELLASTCTTQRQLTGALRRAFRGKPPAKLQSAIDYASRRFPEAHAALVKRAMPFARTAAGGEWRQEGALAWRALYTTDTREAADVVGAMFASVYIYTNHGVKERLVIATAKRFRALRHGKRHRTALREAAGESYIDHEVILSAVALLGDKMAAILEERWTDATTYTPHNTSARATIGGLLAVRPRAAAYQAGAKRVANKLLADDMKRFATMEDIRLLDSIAFGVERGGIRALHPLLAKLGRAKLVPCAFDNHGERWGAYALALLRRRIARIVA
jgi:hypothetical protein